MMFNIATDAYQLNIYLCLKVCNYALYHFFLLILRTEIHINYLNAIDIHDR